MPGTIMPGTSGTGFTGYDSTYSQNSNNMNLRNDAMPNFGTSFPKDTYQPQQQPQSPALNILRPDRTGIANQAYPPGYPSTSNGNVGNQGNLAPASGFPKAFNPQINNYTGAPLQNGYSDNLINPQFGNYLNNTNPPSLAQNQQYGPIAPPPNNYANQYQNGTTPLFAGMPGVVPTRPTNNSPLTDLSAEELAGPKDKLLPFLLLFSIVGNVYLGLWMSHLRTRYRQLLSNMRGIPVADLSRSS